MLYRNILYTSILYLAANLTFAKEETLEDADFDISENLDSSTDLSLDSETEPDLESLMVDKPTKPKTPSITESSTKEPQNRTKILDSLVKKNLLKHNQLKVADLVSSSNYKLITMDFNGAGLKDVIHAFAKESGINFIIADNISSQKISMTLKAVPWNEALDALLETNGLGMTRLKGNVVRIDTISSIEKEKTTLEQVRKNHILFIPTKVLVARLSYAKIKDIEGIVKGMLPSAAYDNRVKVQSDPRTNSIVVEATPDDLEKIKTLIDRIDQQTPQVKIESRVIEILRHVDKFLGINWGGPLRVDAGRGLGFGNLVFPNNITSAFSVDSGARNYDTGGRFDTHLGSINNSVELDLRLRMSELTNFTKSLQNNSVIVLDNEKATIEAGQEDYFSIPTGLDQKSMSSVRFSLLLEVTPHITADGAIQMEIKIENSSPISASPQAASSKNLRSVTTNLLRQNNETAVIGGVYTTSYRESTQGLPFLSKLPIIGLIFKSRGKVEDKRELIILVTPTIINSEKALGKSQSKISQNDEDIIKEPDLDNLMQESTTK